VPYKSPKSQKFIIDADLGNDNTGVIDRKNGDILGAFGKCGTWT
jgi:hypothetical protein